MAKEYVVSKFTENHGMRYRDCHATVTLEVKEDNKVSTITVRYPLQGEKHLMMLMTDTKSGKHISHPDKHTIAAAIKAAIGMEK